MSATCAPGLTEKIAMHNYRNTSDAAKGRGSRERNRWPGDKNAVTSRRSSRRKGVGGVCSDSAGGGVGQSVCLSVGLLSAHATTAAIRKSERSALPASQKT